MKRKFSTSVILPLVGMMIILALAYGFDILIKTLKVQNGMTYSLTDILLWTYAVTNLLLNGALLLLFWWIMTRTSRSAWVGGVFLLAGIYLVVSLGFYRFVGNFIYFFEPPTPGSYLFYALGGIGVIGLFILIPPRDGQPLQDEAIISSAEPDPKLMR